MASKERPPMGHTGKDSPLDGLIDKVEEKRRGVRSPGAIDKVIDKAQESGLTGKLAHNVRKRFSGHLSRKR